MNIVRADVITTEDKKAICNFELEVRDLKHLQNAFRALSKLKNVLKVERLRGLPTGEREETGGWSLRIKFRVSSFGFQFRN